MALSEQQAKLMAAALYEIRVLLQGYKGSDVYVRLAERLAYALHNDALNVIEGDSTFDVTAARGRIEIAQKLVGERFSDGFGLLTGQIEPPSAP